MLCRTLFHPSTKGSGPFPRDEEEHITALVSQDMGNGKKSFSAYPFHVYLTGVIPQAKYLRSTYGPKRARGRMEQRVIAEALQLVPPSYAPKPSQSTERTAPPHAPSELNAVCYSSSLRTPPADFYIEQHGRA